MNPEAAIPAAVIAAILWLVQFFMGQRPIALPPEVGKALKAVEINANKIGEAAEAFTSWHLIVAVLIGFVIGLALARRSQ